MRIAILLVMLLVQLASAATIHIKSPFTSGALYIFGNGEFGWGGSGSRAMNSDGNGWFSINSSTTTGGDALTICVAADWSSERVSIGSLSDLFEGNGEVWVTMSKTGIISKKFFIANNPPTVVTGSASAIKAHGGTINGQITAYDGPVISEYGFLWGTTNTPTTKIIKGTADYIGQFNTVQSGLRAGTKYWFQAYATNSAGTGYGNVVSFTTTLESATKDFILPDTIVIVKGSNALVTAQGVTYPEWSGESPFTQISTSQISVAPTQTSMYWVKNLSQAALHCQERVQRLDTGGGWEIWKAGCRHPQPRVSMPPATDTLSSSTITSIPIMSNHTRENSTHRSTPICLTPTTMYRG